MSDCNTGISTDTTGIKASSQTIELSESDGDDIISFKPSSDKIKNKIDPIVSQLFDNIKQYNNND